MNKEKIVAGLDAGHVRTKAVIMKAGEILGTGDVPTEFDAVSAGRAALLDATKAAGITGAELDGIVATGIFRDLTAAPPLNATLTVPDYQADAKGAFFLNENSRTVIDVGGNVQKSIRFGPNGAVLDVIQNDKCADGLGIFYTTMAKSFGLTEQGLSDLALQSTEDLSVAIQCAAAAQSDAIDLLCQGKPVTDVANAVLKFIVERVADMCNAMSLRDEIVVAGGLARSQSLIRHLESFIHQDIRVPTQPQYVGAIGAAICYGGEK